jgi:hypothetical protein
VSPPWSFGVSVYNIDVMGLLRHGGMGRVFTVACRRRELEPVYEIENNNPARRRMADRAYSVTPLSGRSDGFGKNWGKLSTRLDGDVECVAVQDDSVALRDACAPRTEEVSWIEDTGTRG